MTVHSVAVSTPAPPVPLLRALGDDRVSVNSRFVAVDGEPVFPVSGEIHYSRIPRELWDDVLRGARAGGLTHVATYAFWNHHEDADGTLSFDGDLDVRHFLELAAGHGLGLLLRLGPYVHSEARHGGLPDRIADADWKVRTNDPGYLAEVEKWYAALFEQVRGLELFGVQVDNELYDGPDHLAELRRIAERVGFTAPLWTATAWGAAQLPDDVFPLYGGYTDSFWIEATDLRDDRSLSNFYISHVRDDAGIGADHRMQGLPLPDELDVTPADDHPFATCELGGGMLAAYHRRPVVTGRDIEALGLAKLASGSIWQGYYMYADGRNPRRGLQECHAVGEPNDFMEIGYDFGASLTLDGVPRETWFRLRRQHLFLERWGSGLAAMPAAIPADTPTQPDVTSLRWSVRSDGERGFLFVVNHQPTDVLPAHGDAVFRVGLPGRTVEFPAIDVPSGAAFVLPFGLEVGDVTLDWATAQPVTEVEWEGLPLLVLAEIGSVPARFATDADVVEIEQPGHGRWFRLESAGQARAHILVVSEEESLRLGVLDGRLVFSDGIATDGPAPVTATAEVGWEARAEAGTPPASVVAPNGRASIPLDWSSAARFRLADLSLTGTLVLDWEGDIARAWDGDRLVSDAIYNGRQWRITAPERAGAAELTVEILPLAPDAPVLVCAMACSDDVMAVETALLDALVQTRGFAVDDETLTLTSDDGSTLATFAAQAQGLAGTSWVLTGYNNGAQAVVSPILGVEVTLAFGDDGSLSGFGGCNRLFGDYTSADGEISFGLVGSTNMACASPEGVMEQEAAFIAALSTAATYTIEGDKLAMRTADDAMAVNFVRG